MTFADFLAAESTAQADRLEAINAAIPVGRCYWCGCYLDQYGWKQYWPVLDMPPAPDVSIYGAAHWDPDFNQGAGTWYVPCWSCNPQALGAPGVDR